MKITVEDFNQLLEMLRGIKTGKLGRMSNERIMRAMVLSKYLTAELQLYYKALGHEAAKRKLQFNEPKQFPAYGLKFLTTTGNDRVEYEVKEIYQELSPDDLCSIVDIQSTRVKGLPVRRRKKVQAVLDKHSETVHADHIVASVRQMSQTEVSRHKVLEG